MTELPDGSPLLKQIGEAFTLVGLHELAVKALIKSGDVKAAVDVCVILNQWNTGIELAKEHSLPQINTLFSQYATHLLETGGLHGKISAIHLYRKAEKGVDAAKLLTALAEESYKNANLMQAKKL